MAGSSRLHDSSLSHGSGPHTTTRGASAPAVLGDLAAAERHSVLVMDRYACLALTLPRSGHSCSGDTRLPSTRGRKAAVHGTPLSSEPVLFAIDKAKPLSSMRGGPAFLTLVV